MILDKIKNDLNQALRAKDEIKVSTLRFLLAEIHNREIEKRARPAAGLAELTDEDVLGAIRYQVKQHQESIEVYRQGKRDDLIKKERAELDILNNYLPQRMDDLELEKIVKQTVNEVGASGPADFGKVMGAVMAKVKGQTDGSIVSGLVKKLLSS